MDDDNNMQQSADNALEPKDDIFNPQRDEEKLAEDNDSPAAPADDIRFAAPLDDPATDDGVDSDELYQEGLGGTTNTDDEAVDLDEEPKPLEPEE